MNPLLVEAARIAGRFALRACARRVEVLGGGLINDTFLVDDGACRWVLQRINGTVFPHPEGIMANLARLSRHLRQRPDSGLLVPGLVPATDGGSYVRGDDGAVWRLMAFVEDSRVLERVQNESQAGEVGRLLGRFHRQVHDLPADALQVTLPGFHVTPRYLQGFKRALRHVSDVSFTPELNAALAFVSARQEHVAVLEVARHDGRVPERVIHGDPKLANILFNGDATRPLALIDLDTVQPGLVHYDIADCLRSCCNRAGECPDGRVVPTFDLTLCRALLQGYADQMRELLTKWEIVLLNDAVRLIPFELGLRFLTDHLQGDRYFRVAMRGDNLRKARIQFALVEDIERKDAAIRAVIADCFDSSALTNA